MTCEERFFRRGDDWHSVQCDLPAKWQVSRTLQALSKPRPVCGKHVRRYQRWPEDFRVEPLDAP